jgi:hypothetical protein
MSSEHTSHSAESTSSGEAHNGKYGMNTHRVTGMGGGYGTNNMNGHFNPNGMNGHSGFAGMNGRSSSEGLDRFGITPRMNGLSISDEMNGVDEVSSLDVMLKKLELCRRSDTTREAIVQV